MLKEISNYVDKNIKHITVAKLNYLGVSLMVYVMAYDKIVNNNINIIYLIILFFNLIIGVINHYYSYREKNIMP